MSLALAQPISKDAEHDRESPLTLRTVPDPVLRLVCEPVDSFDRPLRELVEEMRQLMSRHQGIGLAAPQAGLALRIFVVEIGGRRESVVNPRLEACRAGCDEDVEGCLSLPGVELPVARAQAIRVTGRTPGGKVLRFLAEGLWARVVQHEVDHLDGRLISDYAPAQRGGGARQPRHPERVLGPGGAR